MTNLDNLTPAEKEAVLNILQEMSESGESSTYNNIMSRDWDEIPVTIETFLHERKYLGNALYDAEGRFTLYPYWEKVLKDIFPTNTTIKYNTLILTGAIGLGKTLVAVVCQLYLLYRLLCLKDPYLYYGLQPIDKISISLMNITLDNAKGVALDKLNQMILSSEWFMSHGTMAGTVNLEYRPNKHIELITASSNNQVIGRAIYCLDGETEVVTTDGVKKLKNLVDKETKFLTVDSEGVTQFSDNCTVKPTITTEEEIQIELEDGTVLKCTPNHQFLLKSGEYKRADQLTEYDELFDENTIEVNNGTIFI